LNYPSTPILNFLRDGNTFAETSRVEGEQQMDCNVAEWKCNNDALLDVLPF
jgi:hypothetical protein